MLQPSPPSLPLAINNRRSLMDKRKVFTRIAMVSSSLTFLSAPTSSHVTPGIVANPSLFADGWTWDKAAYHVHNMFDKQKKKTLSYLSYFGSCNFLIGNKVGLSSKVRVRPGFVYLILSVHSAPTDFFFLTCGGHSVIQVL